jgi:lysozyme family protein
MAVSLTNLRAANEKRWAVANLTRPFNSAAERLLAAKSRYQAVEAKTGVPWFVIAVIHERESSQLWSASLAQGDPWNRVSTHVPKGRGPFKSWEEAAIDALVNCAPYAARNKDWSVGGTLLMLEQYNGLGYATKGVPSPYLWAGTDQYVAGKYVRDGVYDTTAVDKQLGCAGMIKALMALDSSIKFGAASTAAPPKDSPAATAGPPSPTPTQTVQPPSAWAAFFMAVLGLFKRGSK